MEERTCPVCRENFTATKNNQRFCPPAPGKAKSKCKTAYTNAKQRGTLDKLLAKPWTPPTPFDCAHCGKRCIPGENVARHAAKFCDKDCKAKWHRPRWNAENRERIKEVEARRRLLTSFPPKETPHVVAEYKRVLRRDPCAYCGERPAGGIDHIEPAAVHADRNDVENMTGCCKRCNELKRDLPMLVSLLWVPVSREYHRQRQILWS